MGPFDLDDERQVRLADLLRRLAAEVEARHPIAADYSIKLQDPAEAEPIARWVRYSPPSGLESATITIRWK